jgi:hypothetical protein
LIATSAPSMLVTTLVEHQDAWHTQLSAIAFASGAIVRGLLVIPKVAVPSQQRAFRNHHSWEDDPAAREALGPIIAKWLAQGCSSTWSGTIGNQCS